MWNDPRASPSMAPGLDRLGRGCRARSNTEPSLSRCARRPSLVARQLPLSRRGMHVLGGTDSSARFHALAIQPPWTAQAPECCGVAGGQRRHRDCRRFLQGAVARVRPSVHAAPPIRYIAPVLPARETAERRLDFLEHRGSYSARDRLFELREPGSRALPCAASGFEIASAAALSLQRSQLRLVAPAGGHRSGRRNDLEAERPAAHLAQNGL